MRLMVNGSAVEVAAAPHRTLLSVLRDDLGLTGTKPGCERGECGACTIHLDGEPAYACLTLAVACENVAVTTIEGIAGDPLGQRVQRAFLEHDAAQCGYCTPGQVLAACALLVRRAKPSREEIIRGLSGNLCRCGTYPRIVAAIEQLADAAARG